MAAGEIGDVIKQVAAGDKGERPSAQWQPVGTEEGTGQVATVEKGQVVFRVVACGMRRTADQIAPGV